MANERNKPLPLMSRFPSLRSIGLAVQYFPGYRNTRFNPHSLDVVLLTFIARGRGRHVMGDQVFDETGGSLAITHYGQKHVILTDGEAGMDVYNVYLDLRNHSLPSLPPAFRHVLPDILPLHPGFQNLLNRQVRIQLDDPARIEGLLRMMATEQRDQAPGWDDAVRSCFRVLLIDCCRRAMARGGLERSGEAKPHTALASLERVRRHLDAQYQEPQKLSALARMARLSPSHLSREFHRYTGKRLIDYLVERRLQAAMIELRGTSDKIIAIALRCGFNDLAYFNRRFRRATGLTPGEYRRASTIQPPMS